MNDLISDTLYCNKRLESTKQFQKVSLLGFGDKLRQEVSWRTTHVTTLYYIAKKLLQNEGDAYSVFKDKFATSPLWMQNGLIAMHLKTYQKVLQRCTSVLAHFLNGIFGVAGPFAMNPTTADALAALGVNPAIETSGKVSLLTAFGTVANGRPRFTVNVQVDVF